ncbi:MULTISPECIES: hypothetical protein [unclassified Aminobacter]|uniref:hypothetical protein n=1 Tax=unclassified Aminobacter TaxID=2644704 RepID=UPI0004676125|nr:MULTISPECIES: hypothetical protein [unclassified Aminobacter]TWH31333.1 hypothetical protein L611_002700000200 [Aminobacter sp. J15]
MSVGVVTENSAKAALETVLPPRPISRRPNLVTKAGLKMLQDDLARAHEALEEASRIEDIDERRHQSAVPYRDAQYLAERVRTAQVKPAPASNNVVAFGHKVTFERPNVAPYLKAPNSTLSLTKLKIYGISPNGGAGELHIPPPPA